MRFKRTSAISIGVVMVWMCLAGGYLLLRSGDLFGWVALAMGLVLLSSPLIPGFRWYWSTEDTAPAFPAIMLIANSALLILSGIIAGVYLRDPFLTYNDLDTLAAVVFSVAAALSILALAVNVIALQADRRSG
jgi:hypothetical protein